MLIHVAEHDVAYERGTRLRKYFVAAGSHAPDFFHGAIVKFRQQVSDCGDALVECREYFRQAGRLREVEP